MTWGGLRWSDVQRLQFSSLLLRDGSVRGYSWRAKTSAQGMAFGVLVGGVTGSDWGVQFGQRLMHCQQSDPARDFLMASGGQPMAYTSMLGQMRRCLCDYADLSPETARQFTLHSCKASMPNTCIKKYGRDDVWPQLLSQKKVLKRIACGWCPHVPLSRGLGSKSSMEDATVLASLCKDLDLTDSESDPEEACSGPSSIRDASSDSDAGESDAGHADETTEELEFAGPWLLNARTGWYHRAAHHTTDGVDADEKHWRLSCRPTAPISDWYELRRTDPGLQGFQPCGHWGCFSKKRMKMGPSLGWKTPLV